MCYLFSSQNNYSWRILMSREKHITYLMNCTDDLCLCGVVANQIDLEKLSDDELAMFTTLLNKVRLNQEENNNG
jgi:hypothetical protein